MNCKKGRHENQWTRPHGMTHTREYRAWQGMRERCYSVWHKDYPNYGARGIRVCPRWIDSFEAFFEDMGLAPDGRSLDRQDNEADYSPANCRWATRKEQTRNRRNAINVTINGATKPLADWCDEFGVNYFTAHRKIRREGKAPEQVFGGAR
jgi:hypothetical protein